MLHNQIIRRRSNRRPKHRLVDPCGTAHRTVIPLVKVDVVFDVVAHFSAIAHGWIEPRDLAKTGIGGNTDLVEV